MAPARPNNRAGMTGKKKEKQDYDSIPVNIIGDFWGKVHWGNMTIHFLDEVLTTDVLYTQPTNQLIARWYSRMKRRDTGKKILRIDYEVLINWE